MVKNPLANEEDMGLIPDLGGFHMPWDNKDCPPQFLSHTLESVLRSKGSHRMRNPSTATRGRLHAATKTQHSQKKKEYMYMNN